MCLFLAMPLQNVWSQFYTFTLLLLCAAHVSGNHHKRSLTPHHPLACMHDKPVCGSVLDGAPCLEGVFEACTQLVADMDTQESQISKRNLER